MSGGGEVEDNLLEAEAQVRGKAVSNTSYKLSLSFVKGAQDYNGELQLKFDYKKGSDALFLDSINKKVNKVVVNGTEVSAETAHKDNRIFFPAEHLKEHNDISISYTNTYDKAGNGLHHFVDPEDSQEYLYTNFEPFYAHRLLPCFDQPDIKGKFELTVTAPSDWVAVANNTETKTETQEDGRTKHSFEATPPLSTYLYALVVGPYDKFEDKHGNIPMAIYVRRSLKKFLEPDLKELFTITKQGLDFYNDFFACPYPFAKYDQIFCPEYNIGAMENPGCITFTEHYVYRDPPTDDQKLRRGDTFLHEMAHMWFGDYVSPVWWDGLWLNESFASYMAALAIAEATRFEGKSWLEFHVAYKRWAYREDQLMTTHPIQGKVVDTNSTFQNFDGITYGKGASVLKQLVAVVGMDKFKAGMQYYFKKHAWGNTTIGDFLHAIEVGADRSLTEWSKLWLESAGLNTLKPTWAVEGGKIARFEIEQSAESANPHLRPHKVEIALYDSENGVPKFRTSVLVDVEGAKTSVDKLVGAAAPACVFINHNDHAYAKVLLDPTSLEFMKSSLDKFDDLMTRQLIWSSIYTMVRDAQLPAQEFLNLIVEKIGFETDPKVLQFLIRSAEGTLGNFIPDELYDEHADHFFNLCLKQLQTNANTQDSKIMWARALVGSATTKDNISTLVKMMDTTTGVKDFELDQDMRWSVVSKLAAFAFPDADARLAKEIERDSSDRGKRAVEAYKCCAPDKAVKDAAWNRFMTDKESSMKTINAAMRGFNWRNQKDLLEPFKNKFLEDVHTIFKTREFTWAENFYHLLFPHYLVEGDILERLESFLKTLDSSKDTILVRCVKDSIDDIKRSRACFEVARKYVNKK